MRYYYAHGMTPNRPWYGRWYFILFVALVVAASVGVWQSGVLNNPESGRVMSKRYQEQYIDYVSYCAMYNAKGFCQIYSTRPETRGPYWILSLRTETESWDQYVDQYTFEHINAGETWHYQK